MKKILFNLVLALAIFLQFSSEAQTTITSNLVSTQVTSVNNSLAFFTIDLTITASGGNAYIFGGSQLSADAVSLVGGDHGSIVNIQSWSVSYTPNLAVNATDYGDPMYVVQDGTTSEFVYTISVHANEPATVRGVVKQIFWNPTPTEGSPNVFIGNETVTNYMTDPIVMGTVPEPSVTMLLIPMIGLIRLRTREK